MGTKIKPQIGVKINIDDSSEDIDRVESLLLDSLASAAKALALNRARRLDEMLCVEIFGVTYVASTLGIFRTARFKKGGLID